ncbi:HK97-gp10 family putative phage morphogenesis protein [Novosphingobium sp. 9]|uniref:HK97-gp10 family putative phage morphogenesis protein n=1 Tax=Novosphingobium sp. 9 TaxID=2025349 RepID=UPI0021B5DA22|nr:HK97-gp10 family putative phage morphogenesis protein [Novosphingobium sp. 9]
MKLTGFSDLEKQLAQLADKATMRRVGTRALQVAAEPMLAEAKRLAPDDPATGEGKYLVESIKIGRAANAGQQRAGNSGTQVSTFIGIDGSVKPAKPSTRRFTKKGTGKPGGGVAAYSIFEEMGTATHKAQPYMRPAFEAMKEESVNRAGDALREDIVATAARAARKAARNSNG